MDLNSTYSTKRLHVAREHSVSKSMCIHASFMTIHSALLDVVHCLNLYLMLIKLMLMGGTSKCTKL